jgi:hypothetical protein
VIIAACQWEQPSIRCHSRYRQAIGWQPGSLDHVPKAGLMQHPSTVLLPWLRVRVEVAGMACLLGLQASLPQPIAI